MLEIPLSPIPSQEFQVLLDDQPCRIALYQRGLRMFMDLYVNDAAVCLGAVCQDGADVVQARSLIFKGTLHFYDELGKDAPHYTGLGTRFRLFFFSEGEEIPLALQC